MKKQPTSTVDFNSGIKLKGFKAYVVDNKTSGHEYNRKDFYKISLLSGKFIFHYAEKSFEINEPILFFGNPHIPYSCEVISQSVKGFACVFTDNFLKLNERSESLLHSPLFKIGGTPILKLKKEQMISIGATFQKMIAEQDSDYEFKDEMIRNYMNLIIHEALKLQPSENVPKDKNAAQRITSVFMELLERQFPIESIGHPLKLKTAQDFAARLSVHINYLNRSIKEVTGKSTTSHISERIISEAKALLLHTDWNVSDVAYSLGFEYPTYFNNYFKKMTGTNPSTLRTHKV